MTAIVGHSESVLKDELIVEDTNRPKKSIVSLIQKKPNFMSNDLRHLLDLTNKEQSLKDSI